MKRLILIFFSLVLVFAIGAREGLNPVQENVPEGSKKIASEKTEKFLDQTILEFNKNLQLHARLLTMDLEVFPKNTLATKGKIAGDDCVSNKNQKDPSNNCIRIEQFQFINNGIDKENKGNVSNSMTLFFSDGAEKRDLLKVKTSFYAITNLAKNRVYLEVTDLDPLATVDHDTKVSIFLQHDGIPPVGTIESTNRGFGKYKLSHVTDDAIRMSFKRSSYINNLDFFDKLFNQVYNFNDRDINKREKNNIQFLEGNLRF
ncbi:MAG: hypothetical protein H7A23_13950 [Leptospiraceae bacterium]|nr:hypothetical protein [Leptospiraceae bacterium]MCP5495653.1 hypothetical protein [Leptospiraceae bacterium]